MDRQNAIQQPTEVLLKEIDLENKVRESLDDTQIYFDYNIVPQETELPYPLIKLDLITINKEHNQKFLFHSITGASKIGILKEMLAYIDEFKKQLESFEIEWMDTHNPDKMQTSWFRGNDIFDVLNKFYYSKEKSRFKIFKIKLMPMA
jgi:hypothetical protein